MQFKRCTFTITEHRTHILSNHGVISKIKIQYGKVNLGKPIILCDFDFDHRQHFDVECCCGNIAKIFF